MIIAVTEKGEKMSDWITKFKKEKGYKGCRNCQHQISPMRMCEWAEQKTEVTLFKSDYCPNCGAEMRGES